VIRAGSPGLLGHRRTRLSPFGQTIPPFPAAINTG
jgi:hypothetical protein